MKKNSKEQAKSNMETRDKLVNDMHSCRKVAITCAKKQQDVSHTGLIVIIDDIFKYRIDFGKGLGLVSCEEDIVPSPFWGIIWGNYQCGTDKGKRAAFNIVNKLIRDAQTWRRQQSGDCVTSAYRWFKKHDPVNTRDIELEDILENDINNCQTVAIKGAQKQDVIGHTGLIVLIDGEPKYSIDFGVSGSLSSSAAMKSPCQGNVGVSYYDDKWGDFTESVWEMECSEEEEKEKAIRLLKNLIHPSWTEKYNLILNNCRDYVNKSIAWLLQNDPNHTRNIERFKTWIAEIIRKDAQKFGGLAGGSGAVGAVAGAAGGAVQAGLLSSAVTVTVGALSVPVLPVVFGAVSVVAFGAAVVQGGIALVTRFRKREPLRRQTLEEQKKK